MIDRQKILVFVLFSKVHLWFNFKGREYYKHHMKTNGHSFGDMLDYGTCNVTYSLDKTDYYLS